MRFRSTIAVALLALWMPATMHCQLESAFGLEVLSCCTHEDEPSSAHHDQDDCDADECAVVESGLYKLQDEQCLVPDPPEVIEVTQRALSMDAQEAPQIPETALAPPELLHSWIFSLRAAPAPRAPSV